jgi:hypothetical protein
MVANYRKPNAMNLFAGQLNHRKDFFANSRRFHRRWRPEKQSRFSSVGETSLLFPIGEDLAIGKVFKSPQFYAAAFEPFRNGSRFGSTSASITT